MAGAGNAARGNRRQRNASQPLFCHLWPVTASWPVTDIPIAETADPVRGRSSPPRSHPDRSAPTGWLSKARCPAGERLPSSRSPADGAVPQRFGMVIDAQVQVGEILGRHHDHCRRLLATPVAAGCLARLHRRHQPVRHRQARFAFQARQCRRHGRLPGQHVAGDADPAGGHAAAPFDAVLPGPGGGAAVSVNRMDLPDATPFVPRQRPSIAAAGGSPRAIASRIAGPR